MANYNYASETPGIAFFSYTIRDLIKGSVFEAEDPGFANGEYSNYLDVLEAIQYTKSWSPAPTQIIHYVDCHDNYTLWDKIRSSNPDDSEADQIRQNKLAALMIQTSQGIPFMMSGEEFLRTKVNEDGSFEHNSYASPDSVNLLDYSRIGTYADVYNYYKGLIAFRKAHPAFRMATAEEVDANFESAINKTDRGIVTDSGVVAYTIKGGANGEPSEDVLVVYNPRNEDITVNLPEGKWDIYINDSKAGNEVLGSATGTVSVPRLSGMVLLKGYEPPIAPPVDDDTTSTPDTSKITPGGEETVKTGEQSGTAVVFVIILASATAAAVVSTVSRKSRKAN